ncbi:M14 metallopeptidase family protein [Granulicella sp. dw_53]|uniref:M14 family metallopeptidase n=1 Tax=Granulicella sp. dw_53 TaxID=2719792 RepID=UPI001BD6CA16|nr:M14 metallopeptidase family protein [Granulicella sp. dw_53]
MRLKSFTALSMLGILCLAASAQHITSPEESFGFKPGTDRKLADWTQLTAYFDKLSHESDRIRYQELGKTTEGRPFVSLTISSAENLKHADDYRDIVRRLADSRITSPDQAQELTKRGKAVLVVTCNIHSTEIASSQSAAEFAYRLATGRTQQIQEILDNVILVLVPSLNPDGEQLVVDWYKKYLGTPYEGSLPVVMYHHYVGHDDNRDWYGFTQVETQLAVDKVINPWHPQVLYDLHQMGARGPRIYLPPWVDPIDPNIDPLLVSTMNALGTDTALEVAQSGKSGVLIHGVYDLWSPARHYMAYHGTARVLTESASANIASPIEIPFDKLDRGIGYDAKVRTWNFPDPWKGGTWRLGDIVAYQLDAFFSIAHNVALNRERYLTNYYQILKNATEQKYGGPFAYVIPSEQSDPASTARLISILRRGEVEIKQASTDFDAGDQHFSKGSYIVPLAQPYGAFAKTLLEVQNYPNIREYPGGPLQRPYDVTAQTLPLLLGVKAVEIAHSFNVEGVPVDHAIMAPGTIESGKVKYGYLLDDGSNGSLFALFGLLKHNVRAYRLTGQPYSPGTIYLPVQPHLQEALTAAATRWPVHFKLTTAPVVGSRLEVKLPRIALYQSWVASMDEGWTRWIFDQNEIPYTRVVDADIKKGDLFKRFDAVILPDNSSAAITIGTGGRGEGGGEPSLPSKSTTSVAKVDSSTSSDSREFPATPPEYKGGLGDQGLAALRDFAQDGGTILTLNRASTVYANNDSAEVKNVLAGLANKDFYIPGSILEVKVDRSNPIGFGLPEKLPIFFELSPAFQVQGSGHSIASYTSDNPLLSGWILGGKYLNNTSALVEEPVGKGRLVLFGFRPQYRAQSEATYRLFFNALLYASSIPAVPLESKTSKGSFNAAERGAR